MSDGDDFKSFEDFWPFYVRQHADPLTRQLHVSGTLAALVCATGGLLTRKRWLLAAAPVIGYGAAWSSHFFVEKNKPATFEHPLWSLRGDMRMVRLTLSGKMDAEAKRILEGEPEATPPPESSKRDVMRIVEAPPSSSRLDVN